MTRSEVSIIVPNFNKASFLGQAVEAALSQGGLAEVIVVDDASDDGSRELLSRFAIGNPALKVILLPTRVGGSASRNAGLREAQGRFTMFVDSDDLIDADCCASRLLEATARPDHDLWVFPMRVFKDDPSLPIDFWIPKPGNHLQQFLSHRLPWHTMQPLWRTAFIREIGGFDEGFHRLQDPEVHTKALLRGARVHLSSSTRPDCSYRISPERHDANLTDLATRHAAGAILYYRTFAPRIDRRDLHLLTGTLLSCQEVLVQWWGSGRLPSPELDKLHQELVATCRLEWHVPLLRGSFLAQRISPRHIPGVAKAARIALRLP